MSDAYCCEKILLRLAAAEPTKQVDVASHPLQLIAVAFGCQVVPLTVALKLLPMLCFLVKLVSKLVGSKDISRWWRRWNNSSEFFGHYG